MTSELATRESTQLEFPSISVITATYNAEPSIGMLAESLMRQTDRDFDWCVADGGSSDNTALIVNQSGKRINVQLTIQADFGIYDGINRALRLSNSDYYIICGADDTLDCEAIAMFREAIIKSQADLIAARIRKGDRVFCVRDTSPLIGSQFVYIAGHSVGTAIKKQLHEKVGYYSKRFPIAADQYFILKAMKSGATVFRADFVAGEYGEDGKSSQDVLGSLTEMLRVDVEIQKRPVILTLLAGARLLRHWSKAMRPHHSQ